MLRFLKKHRTNNVIGCTIAAFMFVYVTVDYQSKISQEKFRKISVLKRKVFPVKGGGDRIREQLDYEPNSKKVKTILLLDEHKAWNGLKSGREIFQKKQCPIDTCSITYNAKSVEKADIVITRGLTTDRPILRRDQLWMVYQLESAQNRPVLHSEANWTATYRRDSTLAAPYGWWRPDSDDEAEEQEESGHTADFAGAREGRVAWFVSNCQASNRRLEYARALSTHYPVDIFGACGELKCSRAKPKDCWNMVSKKYKFYLAFENSNCVDYITEKFWDSLKHKLLPIVMGARVEDYEAVAPPNSFLHVDSFSGPEELAEHLKYLDENPRVYNKHFQWVDSGKLTDSRFLCRLCSLLHHPKAPPFHSGIQEWWGGPGGREICNNASWSGSWTL